MVLLQDTLQAAAGMNYKWMHHDDYDAVLDAEFHQSLSKLLPATRHLSATNPRENFFAFLGLYHDRPNELNDEDGVKKQLAPWSAEEMELLIQRKLPLVANYFSDVQALYCIVTKRLLGPGLFVLSHAAQTPLVSDLPSWVPDWRSNVEMIVLGRVEMKAKNKWARLLKMKPYGPFKASGRNQFLINSHIDLRVLELQGYFLDSIKDLRNDLWLTDVWDSSGCLVDSDAIRYFVQRLSRFMVHDYSPKLVHCCSKVSRWLEDRTDFFEPSQYSTSTLEQQCESFSIIKDESNRRSALAWPEKGHLQDFFRIQTANLRLSESEFRPGHPGWHYLSSYIGSSISTYRGAPQSISSASSEQMPSIIPPGYFLFAARVRVRRKIFCTDNGYIGICPEWAEPGDSLLFADGGDVPFLVRCVEENNFRLVGEN